MPTWLRDLLEFLKGFVPAFLKSWFKQMARRQADVNSGAADQRAADDNADTELANEARVRHDEIHGLDDDAFARRRDKWVRPST